MPTWQRLFTAPPDWGTIFPGLLPEEVLRRVPLLVNHCPRLGSPYWSLVPVTDSWEQRGDRQMAASVLSPNLVDV